MSTYKKNIVRPAMALGAIALCAGSLDAFAADTNKARELRILRNDAGTLVQAIKVDSWSLDPATGVLQVQSKSKDRMCAGAMRATKGQQALILDGNNYALERIEASSEDGSVITVRPAAGGLFPFCQSKAKLAAMFSSKSAIVPKGATALSFAIDALQPNGANLVQSLPVVGNITFDVAASPSQVDLTLAQNVMCLQSEAASTGVAINLTDTNNLSTVLRGFESVTYAPALNDQTLTAITSSNIQCMAVPASLGVKEASATGTYACDPSDSIFAGTFENVGANTPANGNLQVNMQLMQNPTPASGSDENIIYRVVVQNCGADTVNQAVIRDYFPMVGSSTLNTGTYQCIEGCSGGGAGYINEAVGAMAPGDRVVIEATRDLVNGGAGGQLPVTIATASPGDMDTLTTNNIKTWDVQILDTNNVAPSVSVTGSLTSVDEDSGTSAASGVTITGSDTDGTIQSVTVESLDTGIVTVSNVSATGQGSAAISVSGFDLTTIADANGTATLRVTITDDKGGTDSATFDVDVNAINDRPSFVLGGGFDKAAIAAKAFVNENPGNNGTCTLPDGGDGQGPLNGAQVACAAQVWQASSTDILNYDDWITATSTGPADESSQTLTSPTLSIASGAALFADGAGVGGKELQLVEDAGNWNLQYVLSGASGSAELELTIADSGGESTTVSFMVSVANPTPVIATVLSGSVDPSTDAQLQLDLEENNRFIGEFSITDGNNPTGPFTVSLSGTDASLFDIYTDVGCNTVSGGTAGNEVLYLCFAANPDYETISEANPQFTLSAEDPEGGITDQMFAISVIDVPNLSLTGVPATVDEGASTGALTVARTGDTTDSVTVTFIVDPVDEGEFRDFGGAITQIDIASGNASASSFGFAGLEDATADGDQMVTITLTAPGHESGEATITVVDID